MGFLARCYGGVFLDVLGFPVGHLLEVVSGYREGVAYLPGFHRVEGIHEIVRFLGCAVGGEKGAVDLLNTLHLAELLRFGGNKVALGVEYDIIVRAGYRRLDERLNVLTLRLDYLRLLVGKQLCSLARRGELRGESGVRWLLRLRLRSELHALFLCGALGFNALLLLLLGFQTELFKAALFGKTLFLNALLAALFLGFRLFA